MKYSLQKRTYLILILLIPAAYIMSGVTLIFVSILLQTLFPNITTFFSPTTAQIAIILLWISSLLLCVLAIYKNQIIIKSDRIIIKSIFKTKTIKKNDIKKITVKKILVKSRNHISVSLNNSWSRDYQYQINISYLLKNKIKEKSFDISKFENKKQLIKDLGARPIYT